MSLNWKTLLKKHGNVLESNVLKMIVAVDDENGIGKDGKLLWSIPEDLARFKALTMGGVLFMGRGTYDSIGKALPGRKTCVLSGDPSFSPGDCTVINNLHEFMELAANEDNAWVVGGESIYKEFLSHVDLLYVTQVTGTYGADTFFPNHHAYQRWENIQTSGTLASAASGLEYRWNVHVPVYR